MIAFEDSDKFSCLPAKGPKGPHMPVWATLSWMSQFHLRVEGGAHFIRGGQTNPYTGSLLDDCSPAFKESMYEMFHPVHFIPGHTPLDEEIIRLDGS